MTTPVSLRHSSSPRRAGCVGGPAFAAPRNDIFPVLRDCRGRTRVNARVQASQGHRNIWAVTFLAMTRALMDVLCGGMGVL